MLNIVCLGARGSAQPLILPRTNRDYFHMLVVGCAGGCAGKFLLGLSISRCHPTWHPSCHLEMGPIMTATVMVMAAAFFYISLELRDFLTENTPSGKIKLCLRVTNTGQETIKDAQVRYSGSAYTGRNVDALMSTLSMLEPGASCICDYELSPTAWEGTQGDRDAINEMPDKLYFELSGSTVAHGRRLIIEDSVPTDFAWFVGGLRKPFQSSLLDRIAIQLTRRSQADPSKLRVLVFGIAGAGKSSFMNSITNMLHNNMQTRVASAAPDGDHVTTKLALTEIQGLPLTMIDTWGLTDHTYSGEELNLIMEGRLPNGWEMKEEKAAPAEDDAFSPMRVPDAVFIVLDADDMNNDALMSKLQANVSKMNRKGYMPIVLVTKLDKMAIEEGDDVALRANPSHLSSKQQDMVKDIYEALGVKKGDAFVLVNYLENTRHFEIDRNLYRILYHGLSSARDYRQQKTGNEEEDLLRPTKVPLVESTMKLIGKSSVLDKLFAVAFLMFCAWIFPYLYNLLPSIKSVVWYSLLIGILIMVVFHTPTTPTNAVGNEINSQGQQAPLPDLDTPSAIESELDDMLGSLRENLPSRESSQGTEVEEEVKEVNASAPWSERVASKLPSRESSTGSDFVPTLSRENSSAAACA